MNPHGPRTLADGEQFPESGKEWWPGDPFGDPEPGIPTGRDVDWEPLVDYRRAGVSETTIHGAVAWASGSEVIHSFGGNVLCYGRSMMKPLMIKVLTDALGPVTTWTQKAIAVSSHNGTPEHIEAAQSLLGESEWGLMQAPLDVPLIQFGRQVRRPRHIAPVNGSPHPIAILSRVRRCRPRAVAQWRRRLTQGWWRQPSKRYAVGSAC
jgi:hypothetical protein